MKIKWVHLLFVVVFETGSCFIIKVDSELKPLSPGLCTPGQVCATSPYFNYPTHTGTPAAAETEEHRNTTSP